MKQWGVWVIILSFACGIVQAEEGYQVIKDENPLKILTPSLAKRQELKIQLDNGLQVLLISDPEATESAAALAVGSGSWENPKDALGMAHFLEHMLFLGTEKYPDENSYTNYLSANGGNRNAYTAPDHTVYIFSVRNEAFLGALDRFAQFFIAPLFTPSATGREMNAIDQENAKNIQDDSWRAYQVRKAIGNPEHPESLFSVGNHETISKISPEALRAWYEAHYSANLMHLVVYSNLPMEALVQATVQDFSAVPDRQIKNAPIETSVFDKKMNGKLVWVLPYQDVRLLTLQWELPLAYREELEILGNFLDEAGPGSLLQLLQQEGLVDDSQSSVELTPPSLLFSWNLSLTPQGVEKRDYILQRCFEELALLRKGIPESLVKEQQELATLKYAYQSRKDLFSVVMSMAGEMINEPLSSYPYHTTVPQADIKELQEALKQLSASNCQFMIIANGSVPPHETLYHEPWMHVDYFVVPFSKKQLDGWDHATAPSFLTLPAPNPFIPKDFTLLHPVKDPLFEIRAPQLLESSDQLTLYYAPDLFFQMPQVAAFLRCHSQALEIVSPKNSALLDLYLACLDDTLQGIQTIANRAGIGYTLQPLRSGFSLQIFGYSDKAAQFLETIAAQLKQPLPMKDHFARIKETLLINYQNALSDPPLKQGIALFQEIFKPDTLPPMEKHQALLTIEAEDFFHFVEQLFKTDFVEALFYGNLSAQESQEMAKHFVASIGGTGWKRSSIPLPRVLTLDDKNPIFTYTKKVEQPGQAAFAILQTGCFSFKEEAALQVLTSALEVPFFSELRTWQQTGYIVLNQALNSQGQLFEILAVQSNTHGACDLLARFELFNENFLKTFKKQELTKERFTDILASYIEELEHSVKNLNEMTTLLSKMAFEYDGDFQWQQKQLQAAKELTYDEAVAFTEQFLGRSNKRRLGIIIEGVLDANNQLLYIPAQSIDEIKEHGDLHTFKENFCPLEEQKAS